MTETDPDQLRALNRETWETAAAGWGLALLPCYLADPVTGLVRVLPASKGVVRGLWLVLHRDLRHVPRVRALVDFLAELLQREQPLLRGAEPASSRRTRGR